jgi:uncharacterized protein Yka (UPF0111/DUF47 family)
MDFLPKQKNFFNLYEALADKIIEAVALMEGLEKNYSQLPKVAQDLNTLESEADKIVRQIIHDLLYDHTRVTEEKGDIKFLAHNMDNVVDCTEKTVNRLVVYKIEDVPQVLVDFTFYLKEAAQEIKTGVSCLRNLDKKGDTLAKCCVRINDLENEADAINRKWLQKIMTNSPETTSDIRQVLALKEIIDLLEDAMDQSEDVANILETFLLKGEA